MSRLTAAMLTALSTATIRPVYMMKLDFASAALAVCTGPYDLVYSGTTYEAAGTFDDLVAAEETLELKASGATIAISGIPAAYIALALTENYRNRSAETYLGCVYSTDPDTLIADPVCLFKGLMDQMEIEDQGETATITISAESKLIDLERPRRLLMTHEDQQLVSAGDKGFEYVASLANQDIVWGR